MEIRTGESALRIDPSMPSYIDISTLFDFFFIFIFMLLRKRDSRESMLGETLMPGDDPEYDRRISRVKYLLLLFFFTFIYLRHCINHGYVFFLFIINKSLIFIWIR